VSFGFAQDNPPGFSAGQTTEYDIYEYTDVDFVVTVEDPDGGQLNVTFEVTSPAGLSLDLEKTSTNVSSGDRIRNGFPVPPGTNGQTIQVTATVTDSTQLTNSLDLLFHVVGANQAPQVDLLLEQGLNDEGTLENPFHNGAVAITASITDPDSHLGGGYRYRWGAEKLSGSYCSGGNQTLFGAEGPEPVVVFPKVSTRVSIRISVTVTDGSLTSEDASHEVTVARVFYVDPDPTGCSDTPPPTNLLNGVVARANPTTVSYGQTVTLIGEVTGQATPPASFSPTWYLLGSTTGGSSTFLSNNWTTSYTAPQETTVLQFRLVVSDGADQVERTVSVTVVSSGGGGSPSCPTCLSGLPPTVDAGPAVLQANS
jgi:hypothetical protein